MAALHTALKAFAPITFSELPTDKHDLDFWLSNIFNQSQLVLDSIPIADVSASGGPVSHSTTSIASNASEMTISSARSAPPVPEHQALQKEWGKPLKLGSKENALGMSVYKLGAKDGRGAWFARHSVHEGLPFSQFKKALEMEFLESLAVQGAPGEGNIRGIGGETRVENITTSEKGKVEVYRLSAQFPGPTTPRDFVTMLITSETAMKGTHEGEPVPRHYMIISKPCDHPETQPQNGFIRGYYESVEFIREVPTKAKTSQSFTDLSKSSKPSESLGKDALIRNAQQRASTTPVEDEKSEANDIIRQSNMTEPHPSPQDTTSNKADPEDGAVEWIMITRSDPGGSVPRFMVERGTPSSICADAEKFLDWACKQDFVGEREAGGFADELKKARPSRRRESFASFRSSRMAGLQDEHDLSHDFQSRAERPIEPHREQNLLMGAVSGAVGAVGAVSGAAAHYLSAYTPQVVLDHLPGHRGLDARRDHLEAISSDDDDDNGDGASTITRGTFESADSHFTTDGSEAGSHDSKNHPEKSPHLSHHEKELRKLQRRRTALENKFSESKTRLEQASSEQMARDEHTAQKATEKHEKELKKQKEKYERELKKLDEKQEREKRKIEAKKRKQEDKDEKAKLKRERDEARQELDLLKKESDILRNMVEDLQRENTKLVAQLGRASLADLSGEEGSLRRRSSSLRRLAEKGRVGTGSPSSSIKSH